MLTPLGAKIDESFDYLSKIDKGRLTWPTVFIVDIVVQTITVFKLIIDDKYNKLFVTVSNQRSIVGQLALRRSKQAVDMSFQCSTC